MKAPLQKRRCRFSAEACRENPKLRGFHAKQREPETSASEKSRGPEEGP